MARASRCSTPRDLRPCRAGPRAPRPASPFQQAQGSIGRKNQRRTGNSSRRSHTRSPSLGTPSRAPPSPMRTLAAGCLPLPRIPIPLQGLSHQSRGRALVIETAKVRRQLRAPYGQRYALDANNGSIFRLLRESWRSESRGTSCGTPGGRSCGWGGANTPTPRSSRSRRPGTPVRRPR
jgi:hypothetical protein